MNYEFETYINRDYNTEKISWGFTFKIKKNESKHFEKECRNLINHLRNEANLQTSVKDYSVKQSWFCDSVEADEFSIKEELYDGDNIEIWIYIS